ncbi:hypothetical protein HPB52_003007 [Rhipicephalus sanguineus]|uniref:Reverse transcriptase domain-containing protein n=1 Tax=Rhipicephalus sanguineus TaxID=34632 RepID=A0A9D4T8D8_RHISA|nr:hypothetical protein HPB52_003007 [Rhipicephalus sanguineus]
MADTPSEDAPDEITVRTSPHATATSRPSAPRKSPAAPMLTRARKLKAAANRLQKGSSSSTPTSRPRVRGIGKLLTPRRRQAPKVKAATAKNAMQTAAAAAEEAAATIPLAPRPPQLHLVPTQKEGSKAELQDDQKPVASTPAGSEEQTSTDSSSPTSSSSWEHNTPLTSSPSLSPSPRALACFRTGICADRPGRQRAIQQALFAASLVHCSIPQASAHSLRAAGNQFLPSPAGCTGLPRRASGRREEKRVTSTGKATLDSLAQAGVSQSVTGNPTLLEPSPLSSGDATRAPDRVASLLSDGVVCLPPTSLPQPQQPPPLSHSKERTGASSATAGAPPNSAASTAPPPPSAFGPMRPLTVHAFTEADYEEARRKHRQKNGFPCPASTATSAPSSRQPASAAPPSKGKGPRQKPGRRQHQLDLIGHLVANVPRGTSATILYRPKGRKNNFLSLSRDAIAAQLSKLPDFIPCDTPCEVRSAIYADDIALFACGPGYHRSALLRSLQVAIDAVDAFLSGIGLTLAASKTEALLVHPRASTRFSTPRLSLRGLPIEWSKTVRYLGVTFDSRLSWRPAVDDLRKGNRKVLIAARSLLARGRGCTPALALRVYNAVASARVLYRAPVASLSACQLAALDTDHRNAVREYYALPHNSQMGPTLAEAGETPISLRITKTALNHVWRLNNTAQGGRLVDRLHSLPHSSLGQRSVEECGIHVRSCTHSSNIQKSFECCL